MKKNNQNPSEIIAYNSLMRKLLKENSQKPKIKKHSQRYSMSRQVKRQIKAIIGAGLTIGSIGSFIAAFAPPSVADASTRVAISTAETHTKEETYSIGLANDGATIIVDGKEFTIDKNSFVIVSGDEAIAYDESGNIHKGYIDEDNFKEIMEMTEEEMSNYTIYQVIVDAGVNVRSTGAIEDGNVISTVQYRDYVLGTRTQTSTIGDEWISTLSTDGETIYEGYIREDLLQEITVIKNEYDLEQEDIENLMIVDTSSVGNSPLNLRTSPDEFDKRTIMTRIPNGSTVNIIGETIISGDREWSKIEYKMDDGYIFEGWVATEYLSPYIQQDKEQAQLEETQASQVTEPIETTQPSQVTEPVETTQPTQVTEPVETTEATEPTVIVEESKINASGNITGIDISSIETDDLRELLQSGIPGSVYSSTFSDTIDTTQVAGDINFVYIKLGASPYGNTNFEPIDYDKYIEQVKVCEELGIPYGFYYYSTSITVEEAEIELEHIKQKIEYLRKNLGIEHNKLEIVVDIELHDATDRQYRGNVEEQTEAKAALINGIQEEGLSDNVLIYGPIRVMRPDLDRIIDLSYLHSLLSNPDNVALWMCSPTYTAGQLTNDIENSIAYAEEQGFSTVAHQVVLDTNVIGHIDINNMNLEHFQKLLNPTASLNKSSYSNQTSDYNDER